MNRKIITVTKDGQMTIPENYYNQLGLGHKAECILENNAIVIRPLSKDVDTGNTEHTAEKIELIVTKKEDSTNSDDILGLE